MMELCCKTIPKKKEANEFSVREIVCCIVELEKHNAIAKEDIARWKGYMSTKKILENKPFDFIDVQCSKQI